jgi:superfamily II DNA or RNA helicase/Holliday junction resolvase
MTFLGELDLSRSTWQAYERAIVRLLQLEGFTGVRLVGQSSDRGADVIGHKNGRRWLLQVKHQRAKVGLQVVDRTIEAMRLYHAQVPVIVATSGFDARVLDARLSLQREGFPLQLWTNADVARRIQRLPIRAAACPVDLRPYQREAIRLLLDRWSDPRERRALVVLATGLGKTAVAGEWIRRLREQATGLRVLAIAHTTALVLQLERSFWPFLAPSDQTVIWTGTEKPASSVLETSPFVFATLDTASSAAASGSLPAFDLLLIDECHHVGPAMYQRVIEALRAGRPGGTFLLGLTATPWRPDEVELEDYFGAPLVSVDIVEGLRQGFVSDVDYRMFTDNIDWSALERLPQGGLSPRDINRTLFVEEWDDAVVRQLAKAWSDVARPRCIVFCKTVDHALRMRDRINALGFAYAEAIHSGTPRHRMAPYERNLGLARFDEGEINAMCAVDIFNEGLDVPDVNIVVFQRVTHSRRIFIQQLGRGLRLSPGKDRVIVLDFVSDIRRFAAGLDMKDKLLVRTPGRVQINSKVTFRRADDDDPQAEAFLRQWLQDVAAVEAAEEDASVLQYPPPISGR